jgi:hypothetical protein
MKTFKILISILVLATIFSFKTKQKLDIKAVAGTYGVCSYQSEGKSLLSLILNDDKTFHYIDKTNPNKPIDVTGNYELSNNQIVLQNFKTTHQFHTKWKIDGNTKCIKAHKGLNFYRLCNVAECK